jgi:hypothetical protein
MPPRFVYWTIVIDGTPTAFRTSTRDELLPTLRQLQRKTPGAVMKWFARGRLWEGPEEATRAQREEQSRRSARRTPRRPSAQSSRTDRGRRHGRRQKH